MVSHQGKEFGLASMQNVLARGMYKYLEINSKVFKIFEGQAVLLCLKQSLPAHKRTSHCTGMDPA